MKLLKGLTIFIIVKYLILVLEKSFKLSYLSSNSNTSANKLDKHTVTNNMEKYSLINDYSNDLFCFILYANAGKLELKANNKYKTESHTKNRFNTKAVSKHKKFLIRNEYRKSSLNHSFKNKIKEEVKLETTEHNLKSHNKNKNQDESDSECELSSLNFSYQNTVTFPEFLFGSRRLKTKLKAPELKLLYKFIDSRNLGFFSSKRWNQFYAFFLSEFISCDTNQDCLIDKDELLACINNNEDLGIIKDTLQNDQTLEQVSQNIVHSLDYDFIGGMNIHGFLTFKRSVIGFRESEVNGLLDQESFRKAFKTAFSSLTIDNFDIDLVFHTGYYLAAKNITDYFFDFPQFFEISRVTNNFMNYGVSIADGYLTYQDTVREADFPGKMNSDLFKRYYYLFETEDIAVSNIDFATSVDPKILRFQDYASLEYWANIFTNYTETNSLSLQRMNLTGFTTMVKEGLRVEYQNYIAYSNFQDETSLMTDNYMINTTDYEFLMNIGSFLETSNKVEYREKSKKFNLRNKKIHEVKISGGSKADNNQLTNKLSMIIGSNQAKSSLFESDLNRDYENNLKMKFDNENFIELKGKSNMENTNTNSNTNSNSISNTNRSNKSINYNKEGSVFNVVKKIQSIKSTKQASNPVENLYRFKKARSGEDTIKKGKGKSRQEEFAANSPDISKLIESGAQNYFKLLDLNDDGHVYFESFISLVKYLQVYKSINTFNADPRGILKTDIVNQRNDILAHPPLTIYEKNKLRSLDSFNCNFMDFLFFLDYMFAPLVFRPYSSDLNKDFVNEAFLVLGLKKLNLNQGDTSFPPFPHVNKKGNNYDFETAVSNGLIRKCMFNTALYQFKSQDYENQLSPEDASNGVNAFNPNNPLAIMSQLNQINTPPNPPPDDQNSADANNSVAGDDSKKKKKK